MSLQDEHLKQALNSAPDHDLVPSDAVRKLVLDYAQGTEKASHGNWIARGLYALRHWQIKSWQLVGMSTLASVFLVMVIVRPQLSGDAVWMDAGEQEIAQIEEPEAAANSAPKITLALPSNSDEIFAPIVNDDLDVELDEALVSEPVEAIRREAKKERADRKPASGHLEVFSKSAVAQGGHDATPTPTPTPTPNTEVVVLAEPGISLADKAESIDAAPIIAKKNRVQGKEKMTLKREAGVLEVPISGMELAQQDIQSGRFRILVSGEAWQEGAPLIDDETSFRIELTDMQAGEVAAYNKVMRGWYHANH